VFGFALRKAEKLAWRKRYNSTRRSARRQGSGREVVQMGNTRISHKGIWGSAWLSKSENAMGMSRDILV